MIINPDIVVGGTDRKLGWLMNMVPAASVHEIAKSYSATAWSAPTLTANTNFQTNDSTTFEKYGTTGLRVKKDGGYLISFEAVTTISPGTEQDYFLDFGNTWRRYDGHSQSFSVSFVYYCPANSVIQVRLNTSATSGIQDLLSFSAMKISG